MIYLLFLAGFLLFLAAFPSTFLAKSLKSSKSDVCNRLGIMENKLEGIRQIIEETADNSSHVNLKTEDAGNTETELSFSGILEKEKHEQAHSQAAVKSTGKDIAEMAKAMRLSIGKYAADAIAAGRSFSEIADELEMGKGEIELILGLYQKQ